MAKAKSTKAKSVLQKFSETVKGLAESASEALKADEPARVDRTAMSYMPFATEGFVSDPLPVPPVAAQPARRSRRKPAKNSPPKKSVRKAARKSASARSKQIAKTTNWKGSKKPARKRRPQ